jgi:hypothetical protein
VLVQQRLGLPAPDLVRRWHVRDVHGFLHVLQIDDSTGSRMVSRPFGAATRMALAIGPMSPRRWRSGGREIVKTLSR